MKVTKELENKIDRLLRSKYNPELESLRAELSKREDEFISVISEEIKNSISENQYFEYFINHQKNSWENIGVYVRRNIRKFTSVPVDESLSKKISELELKMKTEKEDLLIAISYQKDLDGIKEAFEKMGLEF